MKTSEVVRQLEVLRLESVARAEAIDNAINEIMRLVDENAKLKRGIV